MALVTITNNDRVHTLIVREVELERDIGRRAISSQSLLPPSASIEFEVRLGKDLEIGEYHPDRVYTDEKITPGENDV